MNTSQISDTRGLPSDSSQNERLNSGFFKLGVFIGPYTILGNCMVYVGVIFLERRVLIASISIHLMDSLKVLCCVILRACFCFSTQ